MGGHRIGLEIFNRLFMDTFYMFCHLQDADRVPHSLPSVLSCIKKMVEVEMYV